MNACKTLASVIASAAMAVMVSGCGGDSGIDMEINAPILEAVGVNIMGGKKPEPDLPERAPLVLPPRKDGSLPAPGQGSPQQVATANGKSWPTDPEDRKKSEAARLEALRMEYCQKGDWSSKSNIDEFRKNTGQEPRCRPEWIRKATNAQ